MNNSLKNTWAILDQKEKKRFIFLAIIDVIVSIADIIFLVLLLFIIRIYTEPAGSVRYSFLPGWALDKNSLVLITVFLILFSLKNFAGFLSYRAQCRFLAAVSSRLSRQLLRKYLEGPFTNYVNIDSAVHIRKISHQTIEFSYHILGGIQQIITQLSLIILAIIAVIIFNAKIFLLLLLILLPPVVGVFYFLKKRLRRTMLYIKKSSEHALQHLQEALTGFVESNIYNKHQFFTNRYGRNQKTFNKHHSDMLIVQGIPSRLIEIFALLGLFILIAINKWSGSADNETLVIIAAFMAAAYKIIPGIVKILNINSQINTYSYALQDLHEVNIAHEKEKKETPGKNIESIRFDKVSFQYDDHPVLKSLDLEIRQGDFIGIAGLSGNGKTTILNLLLGFLEPLSGQILVNGQNATQHKRQELWPYISYVKQQNFLIHDSILQNITLDETVDEHKLKEVIGISGLGDLVNEAPEGINKLITENGKNISGGQRQRIAIARALYKDADLVILDEPFNELDEESEKLLLQHFKKLTQAGTMIVLITHDRRSLSVCNKIISLDE